MQPFVTAQDLAEALNKLRPTDPMWEEGGFRVDGRWLEIDPDASDRLAARVLGCDLASARERNDAEARWLVAGGVGVIYTEDRGWEAAEVDDGHPGPDWRVTMRRVELTADEQAIILELEEEAAPYLLSEDTTVPYELPGDLGDRMEAALDQIARAHEVDPAEVQAHVDPRSRSAWVTVESSPSEHPGEPAPSLVRRLIHRHLD
jgi:hypothetical protein